MWPAHLSDVRFGQMKVASYSAPDPHTTPSHDEGGEGGGGLGERGGLKKNEASPILTFRRDSVSATLHGIAPNLCLY